jgi:hypothetical protein
LCKEGKETSRKRRKAFGEDLRGKEKLRFPKGAAQKAEPCAKKLSARGGAAPQSAQNPGPSLNHPLWLVIG